MNKIKITLLILIMLSVNSLMAADCKKVETLLDNAEFSKITKNDLPCVTQLITETMTLELPLRVDKYTELTKVTNFSNGLTYQYRLKGLDIELFKKSEKKFIETVTNLSCTNPDTKWMLDAGVSVKQQYFDEKGKYILGFDVSKATCKN